MSPIKWGGLDFDTAAMDAEIVAALSVLAPAGGTLSKLPLTARVRDALDAMSDDLGGIVYREGSPAGQMVRCLGHLEKARVQLEEAHEALRMAQKMIAEAAPHRWACTVCDQEFSTPALAPVPDRSPCCDRGYEEIG